MFTIGLFTTHIPYIAFVLFYAGFFLFGIEKASSGELGDGAQRVQEVVSVSADSFHQVHKENNCVSYYIPETKGEFLNFFLEKELWLFPPGVFLHSTRCCFSVFSRPPPVN